MPSSLRHDSEEVKGALTGADPPLGSGYSPDVSDKGDLHEAADRPHVREGRAGDEARGRARESLRGVIARRLACGILAALLAVAAGCSTASSTTEAPAPVLWTFADLAWYKWLNKVSMNSAVGPIIVGKTVLYGGTYGYTVASQETKTSRLALIDSASGQARWRIEYNGTWGPIALHGGTIAAGLDDRVLGFDLASGAQKWEMPLRARTLTVAGDVVLVAERQMLHALDPVSGRPRWQAKSMSDPSAAGDTALFVEGRTLRAVAAATGEARWSLELPATLAYPQSVRGDRLYLLGGGGAGLGESRDAKP